MSIFKLVIKYFDEIPVGSAFRLTDFKITIISKIIHLNFSDINIITKYTDYLINAEFITILNINSHDPKFIKNIDIPKPINVGVLSKMAKDKQYRILYMRRLKLNQIKNKLNVSI